MPGTREPPSSIFCAFSAKLRGSWSFCSTIYRLRQHCEKKKAERWPLPRPSAGSLERKAPAHDLSTQRASRLPRPPARHVPSPPAWARALPTPSRALSGKPAPPGCAPPARFCGSGLRPAALPSSRLGSRARVVRTTWVRALWPPDGGFSHARLVRSGPKRPARSCVSTPLDLWVRHRPTCRVRARLGLAWEPTAWTSPSAPLVRLLGVGC